MGHEVLAYRIDPDEIVFTFDDLLSNPIMKVVQQPLPEGVLTLAHRRIIARGAFRQLRPGVKFRRFWTSPRSPGSQLKIRTPAVLRTACYGLIPTTR